MLHRPSTTFHRSPAALLFLLPPISNSPPSSSATAASYLPSSPLTTTSQWNSSIRTRLDSGLCAAAVAVFAAMLRSGPRPDAFTLPLVNRAASSLAGRVDLAEAAHSIGIRTSFTCDVYFCNTLMDAYAKHGYIMSARQVFDEMRVRDVVSWTSVVSGYVRVKDTREASRLFSEMRMDGCELSAVTLTVMLHACTVTWDMAAGRQLHCFVVKSGFSNDILVHNSILTFLSTMGCSGDTMKLFEQTLERDTVSWNILISEYSLAGDVPKVVDLYETMRKEQICLSCETLTVVVASFANSGCLWQGEKLHSFVIRSGLIDAILMASFVDLYARCNKPASSILLFEDCKEESSSIWTAMLWGFIHNGQYLEAVNLFARMLSSTFIPNADVLQGLVVSYTRLGALRLGKATHGYIIRNNLAIAADSNNSALETTIVTMYASCGSIGLAQRCFNNIRQKDIVAWSSMIEAYAVHGYGMDALGLFCRMQGEGIRPNGVTFLSLLSACSHSGLVSEACKLFDCMTRKFSITPELGHYTCMVDMLGRSGNLDEAVQVIHGMKVKPDGRIWGVLLASCRMHSDGKLAEFAARKLIDLEPDNAGCLVVLSNIQAGDHRWGEVEYIRSSMVEKDQQKLPAWSCVTETGSL